MKEGTHRHSCVSCAVAFELEIAHAVACPSSRNGLVLGQHCMYLHYDPLGRLSSGALLPQVPMSGRVAWCGQWGGRTKLDFKVLSRWDAF